MEGTTEFSLSAGIAGFSQIHPGDLEQPNESKERQGLGTEPTGTRTGEDRDGRLGVSAIQGAAARLASR